MRDFFIQALDKVVAVILIVGAIALLLVVVAAIFSPQGGILAALAILVFGSLYLIVVGGLMYLFLGIYANTKRMADAMDRQVVPRIDL